VSERAAVPLWVWGARGMLAGELFRLLEQHPGLELAGAVSRAPGELAAAHPHFPDFGATAVDPQRAESDLLATLERGNPAALMLALPHGESCSTWQRLRARLGDAAEGLALVDFSADYRLRDPDLYRAAYGRAHPDPEALASFVYGLPEHHRSRIQEARRVAAPGCFASALQFAVLPTARAGVLDTARPWFFHGITGSSGSGNEPKPGTHHPWRHGNLWAYGLDGHRHEAELLQALAEEGIGARIHFLPHSGPFVRGIHLDATLPLARPLDNAAATQLYADAYEGEPFVQVLSDAVPDLRRVSGSNSVALRAFVREDVLHVLVALDNIVKGGAGQALQCLNLMLGFPETWGLPRSGLGVC
jgi:LysW-gamma-L-alpha-aminoadipyl-6-phosphate/LysW-L-glutamyl-5-phosphate reductase